MSWGTPFGLLGRAGYEEVRSRVTGLTEPPPPEPAPQSAASTWLGRGMVVTKMAFSWSKWAAEQSLNLVDSLVDPAFNVVGLKDVSPPQQAIYVSAGAVCMWLVSIPVLAHSVLISSKIVGSCMLPLIPPALCQLEGPELGLQESAEPLCRPVRAELGLRESAEPAEPVDGIDFLMLDTPPRIAR